jgi:hypothetical protein
MFGHALTITLAIGLIAAAVGCAMAPISSQKAANASAPPAPTTSKVEAQKSSTGPQARGSAQDDNTCGKTFADFLTPDDALSSGSYRVARLEKTAYEKDSRERVPATYAVLKKNGRKLATFDGVYHSLRNDTRFGLAPLLGGGTRQLVISETIPRNGRHWIVDLDSGGKIIFDSGRWGLGEEDVCVRDIDGDGVYEIRMRIVTFWGFCATSSGEKVMPDVVFKYVSRLSQYQPDVRGFVERLTGIEDAVRAIDPRQDPSEGVGAYLAARLNILLRYTYAGRERDGWSFFEAAYNQPDKREVKKQILTALRDDPVYQFIRARRGPTTR